MSEPTDWLSLPEVAQRLDVPITRVRQLLREGEVLALRREQVLRVPADFLDGHRVVKGLAGTITLLRDAGYDDEAVLRWLYQADDSLPGTPIESLRAGRRREVSRRAQAAGY